MIGSVKDKRKEGDCLRSDIAIFGKNRKIDNIFINLKEEDTVRLG